MNLLEVLAENYLRKSYDIKDINEFNAIKLRLSTVRGELVDFANSEEVKNIHQKGLYTEEEVKNMFDAYRVFRNSYTNLNIWDSEEWFERNKKQL